MRVPLWYKFKRVCTKDIMLSTMKSRIDIMLFCAIICSDARDGILYLLYWEILRGKGNALPCKLMFGKQNTVAVVATTQTTLINN